MDPTRRRAALIATGVTVPLVVTLIIVLALLQAPAAPTPTVTSQPSGTILPAVTPAAPPQLTGAQAADCARLLAALPITLGSLAGRPSRPDAGYQTYTAAWGDPAVVLRCGVARPADLTPGSSTQVFAIDGVNYFETGAAGVDVFTVIDRAVYLDVSVPTGYPSPPLQPIDQAIAKVLPQVCTAPQAGAPPVPTARLCTHRP